MTVDFHKCHTMGNDFILIDQQVCGVIEAGWVRQMCDRHYGIGADGLLYLEGDLSDGYQVTLYNADGHPGQFSGNGSKIVADYLMAKHKRTSLSFVMDQTLIEACLTSGRQVDVAVETAITVCKTSNQPQTYEVALNNPHVVVIDHAPAPSKRVDEAVRIVDQSSFEHGANVHWVWPCDGKACYQMVIVERGVGPTLSCGSGAIAVTHVLCKEYDAHNQPMTLQMPGGTTSCYLDAKGRYHLTGLVETIYRGQIVSGDLHKILA